MSTRRKPQPRRRRMFPGPNDTAIGITDTGIKIQVDRFSQDRFPTVTPGVHCWHVLGAWRVADPEAERFDLDVENLVSVTPAMCMWCERMYSRELAAEPCPGDVSAGDRP